LRNKYKEENTAWKFARASNKGIQMQLQEKSHSQMPLQKPIACCGLDVVPPSRLDTGTQQPASPPFAEHSNP
jgi:hypothetical protein